MFINIGFGNMVNPDKIVCMVSPDSAPAKRMIQSAREEGRVIDATCGRRTRGVIVTTDNSVILSSLVPETIAQRTEARNE